MLENPCFLVPEWVEDEFQHRRKTFLSRISSGFWNFPTCICPLFGLLCSFQTFFFLVFWVEGFLLNDQFNWWNHVLTLSRNPDCSDGDLGPFGCRQGWTFGVFVNMFLGNMVFDVWEFPISLPQTGGFILENTQQKRMIFFGYSPLGKAEDIAPGLIPR